MNTNFTFIILLKEKVTAERVKEWFKDSLMPLLEGAFFRMYSNGMMEFRIPGKESGMLVEGDIGRLTF